MGFVECYMSRSLIESGLVECRKSTIVMELAFAGCM